jgi:cell division protein FtsL
MNVFCQLRKKAIEISRGGKMLKINSIYRLFIVLIVCIFVGTLVQTQEHPDGRQNEIQNIERQIEDNENRQNEIEGQLRENPGRPELERELQDLRNENARLHGHLNELRTGSNNGREPTGQGPTFIEFIINALKSPTVWAAIVGAIGAIIAALIGIKKRK